jgi:hypothetical protein
MWICSCQSLAEGRGTYRKVKHGGSRGQSSDPRIRNIIRLNRWDEFTKQNDVHILHGRWDVNNAVHGMKETDILRKV